MAKIEMEFIRISNQNYVTTEGGLMIQTLKVYCIMKNISMSMDDALSDLKKFEFEFNPFLKLTKKIAIS